MKKLLNILSALVIVLSLTSCNQKHEHQGEEAHAAKTFTCPMHPQIVSDKPGTCPICGMDLVAVTQGGGQKQELMLNETQIKLANITVEPVVPEQLGSSTILTGRLVVDEEQTEVISSRVNGRIEKLYIKEVGQKISKGEPLYQIFSEQLLTLQNEYLLALRQANEFKDNERYASFLEASKKKLLLFGVSESEIKRITVNKQTDSRITVTAPYSGFIGEIAATEGQYISEGGILYRVEKLDKIWVEADLYPKEAQLVKEGDQIKVSVNGFGNEQVKGRITFLSPEFRKGSQIVTLRAEIQNAEGNFKPGMQANVIITGSGKKTLSLPTDAVIREESGSHVWVEPEKGVFQPRMVKTGLENFDKVEILEGLEENERVVVTGAYLLYSEFVLKKGSHPMAGHNHSGTSTGIPLGKTKEQPSNSIKPQVSDELEKQVPAEFQRQLSKVLQEYYKLKEAFVKSNASDAAKASKATKGALNKTNMALLKGDDHNRWMKDLELIDKSLKIIMDTNDLEKQRTEFAQLSQSLHKSVKEFKVPDSVVYYQFCPMALNNKGGYWLSNKQEINNPFFGEKMLTCGETKEVMKGRSM